MRIDSGKFFYTKAKWTLRIPLWPRKCAISGDILFLIPAYHGIAYWTKPGETVPEVRWLSQIEYAIMQRQRTK